jgi:hypothetical protein
MGRAKGGGFAYNTPRKEMGQTVVMMMNDEAGDDDDCDGSDDDGRRRKRLWKSMNAVSGRVSGRGRDDAVARG